MKKKLPLDALKVQSFVTGEHASGGVFIASNGTLCASTQICYETPNCTSPDECQIFTLQLTNCGCG